MNLQQQVVLGALAEGAIEEDDLHPGIREFLHEQELVGIVAGQAIGIEDVQAVDGAGGRLVAQALQGRSQQRAATVAVIAEAQFVVDRVAVAGGALRDRLQLAGDGALGLGVRDAGIQGDP